MIVIGAMLRHTFNCHARKGKGERGGKIRFFDDDDDDLCDHVTSLKKKIEIRRSNPIWSEQMKLGRY